jgi:heterodisulfide reductase subunit B
MANEGKKRIWSEYQKEIADDHFFYVRSCIRQSFFPGSEQFFLDFMRNILKKDVYENPSHTTCTGIGYHSDIVPFSTIMTVVARHFALMKESGYKNIAISCVTSFGIYTEIIETWKHFPKELEKTREYLFNATGREFDIPENMAHTSDIIYKFRNEISDRAKYKLVNVQTGKPLRVVEHIGCHYSKMFPKYGVGGAEFPRVLSGMAEAWGVSNTAKKFGSMEPYKPDLILTNCPGCNMFMDKWQYTIREIEGITYGSDGGSIPVLTYEELAGLVLGYNPWDLGLQFHMVQSEPLLNKMGIEYNKEDKYKTKDGRQMPVPQNLMNC